MEIHNSRSEWACREGEDTGPPGNEICGEGLSPLMVLIQWYKISLDRSALTNNNAFNPTALPCWTSHTALQGSKTVNLAFVLSLLCVHVHYHKQKTQLIEYWRVSHRVSLLGGDGLLEVGLAMALGPFVTCGTTVPSSLSFTLCPWSEQLCSLSPAHVIRRCLILGSKVLGTEISESVSWKNASSPAIQVITSPSPA